MTKPSGVPLAAVPCKDCGTLIERKYKGRGQKPQRCDGCRREHLRQYDRDRHRRIAVEIRDPCPRCGGLVEDRPKRRTPYCATCYPLERRERVNAAEHAQRAARERKCRDCGSSIAFNGKRTPRWCGPCIIKRRRATQYGITVADYDALLGLQGHVCGVCGTTDPGERGWFVDHDHHCCDSYRSCGKCVRGLLCGRCNLLLGAAQDSPKVLMRAIAYLANPPALK